MTVYGEETRIMGNNKVVGEGGTGIPREAGGGGGGGIWRRGRRGDWVQGREGRQSGWDNVATNKS